MIPYVDELFSNKLVTKCQEDITNTFSGPWTSNPGTGMCRYNKALRERIYYIPLEYSELSLTSKIESLAKTVDDF